MEYAYEKLLKENGLTVDELPKDAKIGITSIKQIAQAITMQTKKGKTVRNDVLDKVKTYDKWVVSEILEYMDGKQRNSSDGADIKKDAEKVVEVIKADAAKQTPAEVKPDNVEQVPTADPKAIEVDNELKTLLEAGKTKLTLEELKASAKTTYGFIFDNYEAGGQNGVETSHYSVTETEKEVFTIKKV